ncbi:unnamed protein product [Candidula unifasciata]|uniref:Uncharacterized protein n=1 Tax=Candidula unifasciata TaxID=100452 RepID=A0A8S3ZSK6_9EUPU|nr:unnamed protein product [Candidula unifasciata]
MLLWSALGNWLLTLRSMTVNRVRKTMTIGKALTETMHRWVAVVLVVVSVASASCGTIMSSVIPLDMAPRYSGFISGLYSSLTCLASLTSPMFVTAITAKGLYTEWRSVWITMAAVKLTSGLIFLIFGNASLQPWAVSEPNTSTSKILVVPPPDRTQKDVSEALSFHPLET